MPLFPATFNPEPGLRVEGYLHDCWWPGEVVEQHPRKGFRICFDDGDNAWLVRRNVRPMLRRAPHAGSVWNVAGRIIAKGRSGGGSASDGGGDRCSSGVSGSISDMGVASTPPMPMLPMRFPYDVNPHDVVSDPPSRLTLTP